MRLQLVGLYAWTGPRVADVGLGGLRNGGSAVEVVVGLVAAVGGVLGLLVVVVGAAVVLAGMGSGKTGWQATLEWHGGTSL